MRLLFFNAFVKSYWRLIYFDISMLWGNYRKMGNRVRLWPVGTQRLSPDEVERVLYAMDMACIWYRKEVLCLQRAAATSTLLRDYGERAEMIIGTQLLPHQTHAWVEINGKVANDKPHMREKYKVMEQDAPGDTWEAA